MLSSASSKREEKKNMVQTTDGGLDSPDVLLCYCCCNANRNGVVLHVSAGVVVMELCKQIGSANMLKAKINTRFEPNDVGSDAQRREGGTP